MLWSCFAWPVFIPNVGVGYFAFPLHWQNDNPFSVSFEGKNVWDTFELTKFKRETHLCQCPETEAMWVQFKTVSKGMTFHGYSNWEYHMRRRKRSSNKQKKKWRGKIWSRKIIEVKSKLSNAVFGSVSIETSSALSLLLITPQLSQTISPKKKQWLSAIRLLNES